MKLNYSKAINTLLLIILIFVFILILGVESPEICETTGNCSESILFSIIVLTPLITSVMILIILFMVVLIKGDINGKN